MADEDSDTSAETSDECLSILSDKFDPLKALYSDKVKIPVPNAPIYDNVSKFENELLKAARKQTSKDEAPPRKNEESTFVRRFLPHQEPISTKDDARKRRYAEKNFLHKMEKVVGPLGILYFYMEHRTRVKVYTRNASGIRGHIEAYVVAFDSHWNLALEDCLELWTRKVKRKVPALGGKAKEEESFDYPDIHRKIVVKERKGAFETCERHSPQMMLRGEQVVLIVKLD